MTGRPQPQPTHILSASMLKEIEGKPVSRACHPRLRVAGFLAGAVLAIAIGISVLLRLFPAHGPWIARPRQSTCDTRRCRT